MCLGRKQLTLGFCARDKWCNVKVLRKYPGQTNWLKFWQSCALCLRPNSGLVAVDFTQTFHSYFIGAGMTIINSVQVRQPWRKWEMNHITSLKAKQNTTKPDASFMGHNVVALLKIFLLLKKFFYVIARLDRKFRTIIFLSNLSGKVGQKLLIHSDLHQDHLSCVWKHPAANIEKSRLNFCVRDKMMYCEGVCCWRKIFLWFRFYREYKQTETWLAF